jgi:hypothetical protein
VDKFLELLERGVLTTRVITLTLTGLCAYLWVKGIPLDETLRTSWLIIVGFWFNSEVSTQVIKWLMEKK